MYFFPFVNPQRIKITFVTKHVYCNVFILLFKAAYIGQLHRKVDITPIKLLRLCSREFCDR